jgi:DNA-directed RNA polymerase subunit D
METIQEKENQLVFKAKISESLANAIRRHLSQIPVPAVDEVEITKNDSPLYDETISHRIGLIPIKENKSLKPNSEIELKLFSKKEGPVYSEELKGKMEVAFPFMPITVLNKNQEMELNAYVRLGKGETHSKFSPGLMFYREVVDLKIDKDCPKEIIDKCPKGLLKLEGDKVIIEDSLKCDACEVCLEECSKKGKECIQMERTGELVITLESFGQIEKKEMFLRSIDILKNDLNEISKKIK